ncbi:MAG: pyruvate:ferredoxin (flavodoxin) oxidoreductase, partial [Clostridiales bacterium]|nr:pyruvate:ferredoxin (flavodoxin) oxidoreductase [Clostridiales bacterium]
EADFVACHNEAYVHQFDLIKGLVKGGTFLLNCTWSPEELEEKLPASIKSYLALNNIDFYIIDAVHIAEEVGLGGRINMIMQTAFFKLANIIPVDEAIGYLKDAIQKTYGRKGEHIVNMNYAGVDKSLDALVKVEVPAHWAEAVDDETVTEDTRPAFVKNILDPIAKQRGDDLPVSAFIGTEDGSMPPGTAAYEKRGIAIEVPEWQIANCIQCNQCSLVCPHGVIRPFVLNDEEMAAAPKDFETKPAIGRTAKGLGYRIQVSTLDCTGCGVCADICPAKEKALIMKPIDTQVETQRPLWDYAINKVTPKKDLMGRFTLKGSQFQEPLFEFSGACAGCGETPYAKLITQLFGERMLIANATGCSSIWGGSYPSSPYTVNKEGWGPAWANSLFEDNAEYGFGMHLGVEQNRNKLVDLANEVIETNISEELNQALTNWLDNKDKGEESLVATKELLPILENHDDNPAVASMLDLKQYLIKKSQWILGGDGWAYDIGYGGLDHVLASGEDVNVLVFDTEVYSNTGGQASKSTPRAAVAKFAAAGKRIRKKDLGRMAMTYGYVYVAQIGLGANMNHTLKVLQEAEAYPGPSLVIAYSPCIAHGMRGGLTNSSNRTKLAVESGYWHLYRYNPQLKAEGKNPFILDSKEPTKSFQDFLKTEVRYSSLAKTFPEVAEEFFQIAESDAKERYNIYKAMSETTLA